MKEHRKIQKALDWAAKAAFFLAAQFYRLFDPPDWKKRDGKNDK